jgi:hypothetical protein
MATRQILLPRMCFREVPQKMATEYKFGGKHSVWSKISNALKRLGFRSHNFLVQLVSETSRACTIRVRRSGLGRPWNALSAPARLCHRNSRSRTPAAKRISGGGEPDPERSDQGSTATFGRRKNVGRPKLDQETERLVVRMARETRRIADCREPREFTEDVHKLPVSNQKLKFRLKILISASIGHDRLPKLLSEQFGKLST